MLGDLAPVGLLRIDARRKITETNLVVETTLSRSRRSLQGKPLSEVIYHDSPLFELIDRAGRVVGVISAPDMPLDGPTISSRTLCDIRVQQMENGDFLIAFAESLVREGADSAVGVAGFGRILGHEVKNPLAGILGAAQLLERQQVEGQNELLSIIKSEGKRIERLVNRLSAFELFSAPRMNHFNIHEMLDRVLASERAAQGSKIVLHRDYDPSLPEIYGDIDHLHEAFQNVVRNASEAAMAEGGKGSVTIRTAYAAGLGMKRSRLRERLNRAMLVTVEDNGAGIPQDEQTSIFDVFRSSKSGARGLGLSIVSEVVSAHAGHVRVDSEPGRTRFSILLPLRRRESND